MRVDARPPQIVWGRGNPDGSGRRRRNRFPRQRGNSGKGEGDESASRDKNNGVNSCRLNGMINTIVPFASDELMELLFLIELLCSAKNFEWAVKFSSPGATYTGKGDEDFRSDVSRSRGLGLRR